MKIAGSLETALTRAIKGNVDFSTRRRAEYSSDASNYRRIPQGVVFPLDQEDVIATVEICRRFDSSITLRGGGTSTAGNAIGDGVIIDCSRFLNRILEIDPTQRIAKVEPGVVLDDLQTATGKYGLRFGPDPSTHSRCTIGGMIGNNSCGARSLAYGRTLDNVIALEVLTYDGTRIELQQNQTITNDRVGRSTEIYSALQTLSQNHQNLIRQRLGKFPRQISGYPLEQLLPENGFNLARCLIGTEGTCAVVLNATLQLVEEPPARTLVVLGFDDLITAADSVPALLSYQPIAIEGMDAQLLEILSHHSSKSNSRSLLPEGQAWLLVEFSNVLGDELTKIANELVEVSSAIGIKIATTATEQKELWRIREDGAGLASRTPDGNEAWPGWEDAAVPPSQLGSYMRGFKELMARYRLRGAIYGHFGEGCVHTRIDFDFTNTHGISEFRSFITDACRLVAQHGGSFSGEHGDGLARSEFLPLMYGEELVSVFAEFKSIWDPTSRLNPGIMINSPRSDDHLRVDPNRMTIPIETLFSYPEDNGDFAKAVRRCVGVGKCRSDSGGVMCPSYRATHDERDSTRGRARVLHEMLQGEIVNTAWRSQEAKQALDLCLSCKGCKTDCPVNVDMATYKSEFLYHHYSRRLRPITHYSLGWFPTWARLASLAPSIANSMINSPFSSLLKTLGGIAPERPLPVFANQTFRDWFAHYNTHQPKSQKQVLLWVDTFTNYLAPQIGKATVKVLNAAGFQVLLTPEKSICCGLTWISTGQLKTARRKLIQSVNSIYPIIDQGIPMIGLEPSCTAVFRSDLSELLSKDERVKQVSKATLSLAEFIDIHASDWELPQITNDSISQTHCHQHAIMGFSADERIMGRLGLNNTTLDKGCCGLAGNFGFERAHYDVSVAVGEHGLLPTIRESSPETLIISDGFSCRTQISHLTNRSALHLAEIIANNLP